jgi:hypothetical protein
MTAERVEVEMEGRERISMLEEGRGAGVEVRSLAGRGRRAAPYIYSARAGRAGEGPVDAMKEEERGTGREGRLGETRRGLGAVTLRREVQDAYRE